jgi:hypothetical protein
VLPKAGDTDVGESRLSSVFVLICPQMGEPIDKNLWGELEPEEGEFIPSSLLFFH